MDGRRLMLVHAHPDDESIGTGATMAAYSAAGIRVALVTCTLGEEGEVCVPELAHLTSDRDDGLGRHRIGELERACRRLGVTEHHFLGGAGRYRDSGMMGEPSNDHPRCFWRADRDEAAGALVRIVRSFRPQVMVTYDENGLYGHPDHIQAHRIAGLAFDRSGDPEYGGGDGQAPWQPAKFYHTAVSRSEAETGAKRAGRARHPFGAPSVDTVFTVADDRITTEIDAGNQLEAKLAAMDEHRTQIQVHGRVFAFSNNIAQWASGREHYIHVTGAGSWETDLFAGTGT